YRFREGLALAVETVNLLEWDAQEKEAFKLRWKLKVWSRFIHWFERKFNFISIGERSSSSEREHFLFRLGNLKKYISRILYLQMKSNLFFSIRSQASYMIAAGIAAFWYF